MTELSTPLPGASPMTRRLTGAAAIAAPTLLLASTLAYITDGNGINDGRVGGAIGVWSCLAFLLAFIGVWRLLEPVAPSAAPIWLAVAVIGAAAGLGFNIDAILAAEFGRNTVDAVMEESAIVLLAYLPWGLFFPVGLIGTGLLMWRAGDMPRPIAGLVVAGGVLFLASRPSRIDALAVVADGVLMLAFVPIGWSLMAGRSLAGDAGARRATSAIA